MVFAPIFHRDGIPDDVVMDAAGIEVRPDHGLEFPIKKPVRKLQADLVGKFRRDLARRKTLHQMKPLHAARLVPDFFDSPHIHKCRSGRAAKTGFEQVLLSFIPVESIVHGLFH